MPKAAKTQRPPGKLERLVAALPKNPPGWLLTFARKQDELNRYLWLAIQNSLPAKHAPTHLGGSDNLVSGIAPSKIEFGNVADAGTPQLGVSARNHVHEVDLDFNAFPIPETGIKGNPSPPFTTLQQQTDWLNAQAVREYALRPVVASLYS